MEHSRNELSSGKGGTVMKPKVKKWMTPSQISARVEVVSTRIKRLTQQLSQVEASYLTIGQKETRWLAWKFHTLARKNRQMSRLKAKIQHLKNELHYLNLGQVEAFNPVSRFFKFFREMPYDKQKIVFGLAFVLPWFLGFLIFFSVPLLTTLWWSLNRMAPAQGGGFQMSFAWFQNYRDLFVSETLAGTTVLEVLTRSIMAILIDLPTIIIFSLFIAVLLNTKFKGHQIVKAIFFIPVVYNMTVINNTLSGTFGQLFDSSLESGFQLSQTFSAFLMQIGIGGGLIEFLLSAVDRIFLIVNRSGIQIIIFIAALQSIPIHLYESARVEGATKYEMFWKVTFPLVTPMVLTTLVFTIVDSFGSSEIMRFLTVNSQGTTMATNQPGLYSAISVIYFLVNIFIVVFAFGLLRKSVFYYD